MIMTYDATCLNNWQNIQKTLFPYGIPIRCKWNDRKEIIGILNEIGSVADSNHLFFPNGGGLDLKGCSESWELNCIELNTKQIHVIKPKSLSFESFPNTPEWNYFRLEIDSLQNSGIEETGDAIYEELTELKPGHYIESWHMELNEYMNEPMPKTARNVTRWFGGSMVIFSKGSAYNDHSATYDGRHNSMNEDSFRKYIEVVIEKGW